MNTSQPRLAQALKQPSKRIFDEKSSWICLYPHPFTVAAVKGFPYAQQLKKRREQLGLKEADTEPVIMDLPNTAASHLAFACIKPDISTFGLLTLARKLVAAHDVKKVNEISVAIQGFETNTAERMAEAVIAAIYSAAADMPSYKSTGTKQAALKRVTLHGLRTRHGFKRTRAEAEGNAVARYLSILPTNKLTPALYLRQVRGMAREYGWKLEFLDTNALQRKKAGAFLAVCQGSPARDAGIIRLEYRPKSTRPRAKLALAGKGICYDTGGTNLKTGKYMFGMHEDMQGSSVALGTLIALTRLQVNFQVECWLALASNDIGPRAYKPNDVIRASDGTTIEIVHTDAEGRMVLADTLAMASKKKPALLIDYATLTGAAVYSLGTAYSGVFTNKDEFNPVLIEAGRQSGERVWPFPMDDDYEKALESRIADVKQCVLEGNADHIMAARFLQRFVKEDTPWVHVDLAASSNKGGLAHVPTDTTGFGIRFTLNLVLDQKLMQKSN